MGSYTITPSGLTSDNYEITFNAGTLTVVKREVTLDWANTTFTYDGNTHAPTAEATGTVNNDAIGVTVTGAQTNAGSYTATASALTGGKADNYKLPAANTQSFTITKATATVTAPTAKTLTYDGTAQALVEAGSTTGGTMQYSLNGIDYSTVIPTGINAGSYTVYYKVVGGDNYNDVTADTVDVTIDKKTVTVTADAKSKIYGAADPDLTYTAEGLETGDTITGALSRAEGENVGTYAITQGTLTAGDNYTISYTGADLTISAKALTVTANANTITYGDAPADNGVTYSGFVNDETASVLGGELAYTYNYAQYGDVGSYTITPSGLTSDNYAITFKAGTLTVVKREVTLAWANTSFLYDGSSHAPAATAGNLVNDDVIAVTVTGAQTNAGSYIATASALTGGKAGNYKLPAANTQSFTISPKAVTITVANASKHVGEADPVFTGTVDGLVNEGDLGTITYSRTGNDEARGTYTGVLTASYTANENYTVTVVPGDFTITLADGFYLIGPNWTANAISAANRFVKNPVNDAEYMLTTVLTQGQEIKVVKVENDAITVWYPDGQDNEYTVEAQYACRVTIYFNEWKNNDWSILSKYIYISGPQHDYQATVTKPTCTEAGYTTYICSICGDRYTDTPVAALGHNMTEHAVVAATCTEEGNSAYWSCSRCGKYFSDAQGNTEIAANSWVTSALGHSWGAPAWSWTGTTSATATFTCSRDSSHTDTKTAVITSAAGAGDDLGYTVYTATVSFNSSTYTDTNKEPITYTITYNLAGGSVATANPTSYTVESSAITLNNPTREGYTFAGWTGAGLSAATTTVTIAAGSTGDRSYTATWTRITYTISYELAGGSVATANPTSYTVESDAITLNNPERTGYTFAGWTGTGLSGALTTVTIAQGSTGDRSYAATWNPIVTFNANAPTGTTATGTMDPQTVTNNTPTALTANAFAVAGYTFTGWNTAAEGSGTPYTDGQSVTLTAPLTLYAQWNKLNTFTHSTAFANVDSYLYRVGNGNTVTLGSLFKVHEQGDNDVDSSNVKIKVEAVETDSSVKGTVANNNLESGSTAKCVYTRATGNNPWTASTLRFTGEGPVRVTIKEGTGTEYVLNLEVVTGNNITAYSQWQSSGKNMVLLNDITLSSNANPTMSGNKLFGNGFTIDATAGMRTDHGVIAMYSGSSMDNAVVNGPVFNSIVGTANTDGFASTIAMNVNTKLTNCHVTGGRGAVRTMGNCTIEDTVLAGGILANLLITGGDVVVNNLTTINTQNSTAILFYLEASGSITINGTLTQHNFISENASMSGYAGTIKSAVFGSGYSKYHFTDGNGTKYVNMGIISATSSVGAEQIIDNRADKQHYSGKSASMLGTTGYVYTMENTDSSALETNYEEGDYTPSAQAPYEPKFSWAIGDQEIAAGGDRHCFKDTDGKLKIQFLKKSTFELDVSALPTCIKYEDELLEPTISCSNSYGSPIAINDGIITFTAAGEYTIYYTYTDDSVYTESMETGSRSYVFTINVNVDVKKGGRDAVIETVQNPNMTILYNAYGSTAGYGSDFQPNAPALNPIKITDYDDSGNAITVCNGENQSDFVSKIAKIETESDNRTGYTIYLINGTKLKVTCGAPYHSQGTLGFHKRNNVFYMYGKTAISSRNKDNYTYSWSITKYEYTGLNGTTVTLTGTFTFSAAVVSNCHVSGFENISTAKSLVYVLDGGDMPDGVAEYTTTSPATLPQPTKDGYSFREWNTKADGTGTQYQPGANYKFSSLTYLYAIWFVPAKVNFNANGGECSTSYLVNSAGTGITLPNTSYEGHWLKGWYTAASGGTKIGDPGAVYNPTENITLYAQWGENYTVTYNTNGGNAVSPASATYTGTALTLPNDTWSGHQFNGWYDAASGGNKIGNADASYTPTDNVTLYAQWTAYTVTFNANKGTVSPASASAGSDGSVTLPTPTRPNWTFNGWYTTASGSDKVGDANASYTPTADTTIYAHWKCTVTYDANGGPVSPASATVDEGASTTLPAATNGSKTFEGWFTAAEGGAKVGAKNDSYTPNGNITLYAQWSDNILVEFDGNGGTAGTNSDTYDNVTPITLPTATRAGHQFNGWYTASSGGTRAGGAGDSYVPTEPTTLYAQWTAYTVSFDGNGATNPSSLSAGNNGSVTLPNTTRTGYTLNGWYTAASGGTKVGNDGASYTPTADITLHAQWTVNSYKVTITTSNSSTAVSVNGTTVTSGGSVAYNSVVKVDLSYTQSNSLTFTIKQGNTNVTYYTNAECTKSSTSTDAGTYYFKMPAGDVTINSSSTSGGGICFATGTIITLADGTQKPIEDIKTTDMIMSFNHATGEFEGKPIAALVNHGESVYDVLVLSLSDGTELSIIGEHGLFDMTLMKYININQFNYESYIGHQFAKYSGTTKVEEFVTLMSADVIRKETSSWSIWSYENMNHVINGLLGVTTGIGGEFVDGYNLFDFDEELKYDTIKMYADIQTYGLYTYDEWEEYLDYDSFVKFNIAYFKVAVGKGYLTKEMIVSYINWYYHFAETGELIH